MPPRQRNQTEEVGAGPGDQPRGEQLLDVTALVPMYQPMIDFPISNSNQISANDTSRLYR